MSERAQLRVRAEAAGTRLDSFVADQLPDVSRTLAANLIRSGKVVVDGDPRKPSYSLMGGELVEVEVEHPATLSAAPEDIPLAIVYQDADLVIIDKPAGLVVHPAPGHSGGTLVNALAARFPHIQGLGALERPGIVHRLDKDTSGLMVVALTPAAMASLQRQIGSHQMGRRYLALSTGHFGRQEGTINGPIGRDPAHRSRMLVHGIAARPAQTSYRVLEELPGFDLLELKLHTGRTHQIRAHLRAVGHPVAGDILYNGRELPGLHRQFLHAHRLDLLSPTTGAALGFRSPLPPDLQSVINQLRAE